jgi:hypothetical protein
MAEDPPENSPDALSPMDTAQFGVTGLYRDVACTSANPLANSVGFMGCG